MSRGFINIPDHGFRVGQRVIVFNYRRKPKMENGDRADGVWEYGFIVRAEYHLSEGNKINNGFWLFTVKLERDDAIYIYVGKDKLSTT